MTTYADILDAHRYDRVLSLALGHPWALASPMREIVATILAWRITGHSGHAPDLAAFTPREATPTAPVTSNGVAVIPLHGVIAPRMNLMSDVSGGATYEEAGAHLAAAMADPAITTIVLDVDSPGGSVAGATTFAHALLAAREQKRILAQAHHSMCSAAYWVASCATEVIATPSAILGSIGVYTIHDDLSAALEKLGVKREFVEAGKYKTDGNETGPLTDTARARQQTIVNEFYSQFITDVAAGRRATTDAIRNGYGEGAVVTASEAKALGMVDRIDTLDSTIARAFTLPPIGEGPRVARVATTRNLESALYALGL